MPVSHANLIAKRTRYFGTAVQLPVLEAALIGQADPLALDVARTVYQAALSGPRGQSPAVASSGGALTFGDAQVVLDNVNESNSSIGIFPLGAALTSELSLYGGTLRPDGSGDGPNMDLYVEYGGSGIVLTLADRFNTQNKGRIGLQAGSTGASLFIERVDEGIGVTRLNLTVDVDGDLTVNGAKVALQ